MVIDYTEEFQRRRTNGLWRLDYLEAGIRRRPEPLPHVYRVWVHGAISAGRRRYDLVSAWAVIAIVSATGGAGIATLIQCGIR